MMKNTGQCHGLTNDRSGTIMCTLRQKLHNRYTNAQSKSQQLHYRHISCTEYQITLI